MLNMLAILAFGVLVQGGYVRMDYGSECQDGLAAVQNIQECIEAIKSFGYSDVRVNVTPAHQRNRPEACYIEERSNGAKLYYFNYNAVTTSCGSVDLDTQTSYDCVCAEVEGVMCTEVRKPRTCRALSKYCEFQGRREYPRCKNKDPQTGIPMKEFCEAIPTRKWCKKKATCFWTGASCMLKSEATCEHIEKRRTCKSYTSDCLNGNQCLLYNAGSCTTGAAAC